jgi:hypothetical protein
MRPLMADSTHSGLTAFLLAQLREGMTVVDIGANRGELTAVAAACVGTSGRVVAYEPSPATIPVTVQTLDAEAPLLPPVDLIKIDAQGAEGRIFEGARRLLKRDKPLLIFELWPHGLRAAGTDGTRLLDDLAGLGYHFHPLNAKGRVGHDGKIRALLAGELRSAALNVVAHPRRWPAREWREVRPPEACVLPRPQRGLCHAWIASESAAAAALSV